MCQKFLGRPSLPRRDVELPRRDVKITSLCHVATSNVHLSVTSRRGFTRRDVIFDPSLPRRDVDVHVATSIGTGLCHVATWPCTSRRRLFMCSVTSRRDPERRDVTLNVATWSCLLSVTSQRHPARRDVTMFLAQEWFILALHLTHLTHRNPSSPAYQPSPDL